MKKVTQTQLHNPPETNGNCMVAALASLLELDIYEIPAFGDMEENKWFFALLDWLHERGLHLVQWDGEVHPPGYHICNGPSPRGFEHSVVYYGTDLVHDPHPSREGLKEVTSVWALLPDNPVKGDGIRTGS